MGGTASITFHGGARTGTGSCFLIESEGCRILVDCGFFRGTRSLEKIAFEELPFDPATIDAVVLTQVHDDHSGRVPQLYKMGCRAPVICTVPTAALLKPVLEDSLAQQKVSVRRRNSRVDRIGLDRFELLYDFADVETVLAHLQVQQYGQAVAIGDNVSITLWDSRFIIGSASIEINIDGQRLMLSGDIGSSAPVGKAGQETGGYDHVVCEATYGSHDRPEILISERRNALADLVNGTLGKSGNVLIPAFAVERTHVILEDLFTLFDTGRLNDADIWIDSPNAREISAAILEYRDSGNDLLSRPNLHFVHSEEDSVRLAAKRGSIIISGSGMCESGRIRRHLVQCLPDPNSMVLFTGHCASGTLGSVLTAGVGSVRISGDTVPVRSQISTIAGYSEHADRKNLLHWIRDRQPIHGTLFLVQGEKAALEGLHEAVTASEMDFDLQTPTLGEQWRLEKGKPAQLISPARADAEMKVSPTDWHTKFAELRCSMAQLIQKLPTDEERDRIIDELKSAMPHGL